MYALATAGSPRREEVGGVTVHRSSVRRQRDFTTRGLLFEYGRFLLSALGHVARQPRMDVVVVANPPDFLLAAGIRPASPRGAWRHAWVQSQFNGLLIIRRKLYAAALRRVLRDTMAVRDKADYTLALVSAVVLQIVALVRSLRIEDHVPAEYRKTVVWFTSSAVVLLAGLLIAAVALSGSAEPR